jgi:hypothetical protein
MRRRGLLWVLGFALCPAWAFAQIVRYNFDVRPVVSHEMEFVIEYRESQTFYDVDVDPNKSDFLGMKVKRYSYKSLSNGNKIIKIVFDTNSKISWYDNEMISVNLVYKTGNPPTVRNMNIQSRILYSTLYNTFFSWYVEKEKRLTVYNKQGFPRDGLFWLATTGNLYGDGFRNGEIIEVPNYYELVLHGIMRSALWYTNFNQRGYSYEVYTTGDLDMYTIDNYRIENNALKDIVMRKIERATLSRIPYINVQEITPMKEEKITSIDSSWKLIIKPKKKNGSGYINLIIKNESGDEIHKYFLVVKFIDIPSINIAKNFSGSRNTYFYNMNLNNNIFTKSNFLKIGPVADPGTYVLTKIYREVHVKINDSLYKRCVFVDMTGELVEGSRAGAVYSNPGNFYLKNYYINKVDLGDIVHIQFVDEKFSDIIEEKTSGDLKNFLEYIVKKYPNIKDREIYDIRKNRLLEFTKYTLIFEDSLDFVNPILAHYNTQVSGSNYCGPITSTTNVSWQFVENNGIYDSRPRKRIFKIEIYKFEDAIYAEFDGVIIQDGKFLLVNNYVENEETFSKDNINIKISSDKDVIKYTDIDRTRKIKFIVTCEKNNLPMANQDLYITGPYSEEGYVGDHPLILPHPVRTDVHGRYEFEWNLPSQAWFEGKKMPYVFSFRVKTEGASAEATVKVTKYVLRGLVYRQHPTRGRIPVEGAEVSLDADFQRGVVRSDGRGLFELPVEKPDSYRVYVRHPEQMPDGFPFWTRNQGRVELRDEGQNPDTLRLLLARLPHQALSWRGPWQMRLRSALQGWPQNPVFEALVDSVDAYLQWLVEKQQTEPYDEESALRLMQAANSLYMILPRSTELADSALSRFFSSLDALVLLPMDLLVALLPNIVEKLASSHIQYLAAVGKPLNNLLSAFKNALQKTSDALLEQAYGKYYMERVAREFLLKDFVNKYSDLYIKINNQDLMYEVIINTIRKYEIKFGVSIEKPDYYLAAKRSYVWFSNEYGKIINNSIAKFRDLEIKSEKIALSYKRVSEIIDDFMRNISLMAAENVGIIDNIRQLSSQIFLILNEVKKNYDDYKKLNEELYKNIYIKNMEVAFWEKIRSVEYAKKYGYGKYRGAYEQDISASRDRTERIVAWLDRLSADMYRTRFWSETIIKDFIEPIIGAAGSIATLATAGSAAPIALAVDVIEKLITRFGFILYDLQTLYRLYSTELPTAALQTQEAIKNAFGRYTSSLAARDAFRTEFWKLKIFSPLSAVAADSSGLLVGQDARGRQYSFLPGATFWRDDSTHTEQLRLPPLGRGHVLLFGTGDGPFRLEWVAVDSTGQETLLWSWQGQARPNWRARLLLDPIRNVPLGLEERPPVGRLYLFPVDSSGTPQEVPIPVGVPQRWGVRTLYEGDVSLFPQTLRAQSEHNEILSVSVEGDSLLLLQPRRPGQVRLSVEADGLRRDVVVRVLGPHLEAQLERDRYQPGELVQLSGQLWNRDGTPMAGAPVLITLNWPDSLITRTVQSDGSGRWTWTYRLGNQSPNALLWLQARYGPLPDSSYLTWLGSMQVLAQGPKETIYSRLGRQTAPLAEARAPQSALSGAAPSIQLEQLDSLSALVILKPYRMNIYRELGPMVAYTVLDEAGLQMPRLSGPITVRLYVAQADSAPRGTRRLLYWTNPSSWPQELGPDLSRASWAEVNLTNPRGILQLVERNTATYAHEESPEVPDRLQLDPAYPNPFRTQAHIRFGLPRAERVWLEVYDLLGRRVRVLIDGELLGPGWHTATLRAGELASGVYFYRLRTAQEALPARKVVLVR